MIAGKDFYQVLSALVPLYLTMGLAYASVRRWKIFTAEQCAGINRFVAVFAVPFLSFTFVAQNNLYQMNYRFIAADTLQKTSLLAFLLLLSKTPLPFRRRRRQTISSIDWTITLFSLSTLPNTLVVGIPLLAAMYGGFTSPLMVQIVVFQGVVWNTVLLALFEYRAALLFIADQFPVSGTAARISSVRVESDVVSLHTSSTVGASVAEIDERGNLHVLVARKSADTDSSRFSISSSRLMAMINKNNKNSSAGADPARKSGGPPRASDLTGVEIWSARTSPRNSSFVGEDDNGGNRNVVGGRRSLHHHYHRHENQSLRPPPPSPQLLHMFSWSGMNNTASFPGYYCRNNLNDNGYIGKINNQAWSSGDINSAAEAAESLRTNGDSDHIAGDHRRTKSTDVEKEDQPEEGDEEEEEEKKGMAPPARVMTRLVLLMMWKKLVRNPNSYASLFGVVWSLVAFRWDLTLPSAMVKNSVSILANTGLGMAMFSLGLFMALQPKLIACGKWMALMAMATRFLLGPGVAAAAALAVGIRGVLLRVMIVQAALPQGILPFVFAKEYNLHPDILSTAVIFGMVLALPITIIYYVVLGL